MGNLKLRVCAFKTVQVTLSGNLKQMLAGFTGPACAATTKRTLKTNGF